MNEHNQAPIRLILLVLAFVLFMLGSFLWWTAPDSPHRMRLISGGLACWVLSTFF
jgi:hypothetical protein